MIEQLSIQDGFAPEANVGDCYASKNTKKLGKDN